MVTEICHNRNDSAISVAYIWLMIFTHPTMCSIDLYNLYTKHLIKQFLRRKYPWNLKLFWGFYIILQFIFVINIQSFHNWPIRMWIDKDGFCNVICSFQKKNHVFDFRCHWSIIRLCRFWTWWEYLTSDLNSFFKTRLDHFSTVQ